MLHRPHVPVSVRVWGPAYPGCRRGPALHPAELEPPARALSLPTLQFPSYNTHAQPAPRSPPPLPQIPEKARHYGISAALPEPVDPSEGLVLQYELKLPKSGLTCGGAYLKFLTATPDFTPAGLKESTPYTVMFGPDKCGGVNKVHLIVRHTSPLTGEIEEKHLQSSVLFPNDDLTHVYTAELLPSDNSFRVLIDGVEKKAGSLGTEFAPPFDPPATIADPEDVKPEDWVDEAMIPDPDAVKPEDWDEDAPATVEDEDAAKPEGWLEDEPAEVEDPAATEPEDWDEEEDGEWEAPLIPNPKCSVGCGPWKRPTKPNPAYKGRWFAPKIANPAYKGPWAPRDIPNPKHVVDPEPLSHIGKVGGVALEVWTMDADYYFDNVVVTSDPEEAERVRAETWAAKHAAEIKAAEEALAKEAAKKPKKAAGDDDDDEEEELSLAEELVARLFDAPFLAKYEEQLAPLRELAEDNAMPFLGALAGIALAVVVPLVKALLGGGAAPAPTPAAPAKKTDAVVPDDVPAEEEAAAEEEADEEEEEEEEEKPAAAARRRTRRD